MKNTTLSLPTGWMTALLIMCFVGAANAQKLKNAQEVSLRAPAGAKADAKLGEWGELQAYNKATQLYYTIANDDKNLFLVVKISDATNINKVLAGGIDLTINTAGKKKDKDAFIVTFPVVNRNAMRNAMRSRAGGGGGFGGGAQPGAPVDSAVILAMRKQAISAIKEIKVLGFKEITDTLISIYNEYSIKAVVNYDEKGALVYELSLPLSLLKISTDAPKEFAYNLKVNGLQIPNRGGFGGGGGGGFNGGGGGGGRNGGGGGGGNAGGGGARPGGGGFNMEEMTTPTDFWGKYTLAKP